MSEPYIDLSFQQVEWCFLYSLWDMQTGGRLKPGVEGMYGREDPETGAPYLCHTEGRHEKTLRPLISRDYEASHVYPERLFLWGTDNRQEPVPFETLLAICKLVGLRGDGFWEPTFVHRGYVGGVATWRHALRSETNIGPGMYDAARKIEAKNEEWQVVRRGNLLNCMIYGEELEKLQAAMKA